MNLWELGIDRSARVLGVAASLSDTYKQRLSDLGIQEGCAVSCVRRSPLNGPKVYAFSDHILALDKEIAELVEVMV